MDKQNSFGQDVNTMLQTDFPLWEGNITRSMVQDI